VSVIGLLRRGILVEQAGLCRCFNAFDYLNDELNVRTCQMWFFIAPS